FGGADLTQAAAELALVIRGVRPQVLVTYDANGGYGHPDHIQAHRVAREGVRLAAGSADLGAGPWQVAKFYATAVPQSVAAAAGLPYWVPGQQVTTGLDGGPDPGAKAAALRGHATQIVLDGDRFALSDGRWQPIGGREFYTLLAGVPGPGTPEHDLFAGLEARGDPLVNYGQCHAAAAGPNAAQCPPPPPRHDPPPTP